MTGNKEAIDKKFVKDKDSELLSARHAWRSLLVPAVGSAAFFASTIIGFIRTYRKYGFPQDAFKSFDYALMGIPFAIIGMAFLYQAEEIKQEDGNAEV